MKLTGDLKKKVEAAESRDEAKKTIEDAGMLLTDAELDAVSGGFGDGVQPRQVCVIVHAYIWDKPAPPDQRVMVGDCLSGSVLTISADAYACRVGKDTFLTYYHVLSGGWPEVTGYVETTDVAEV